MRVPEFIYGTHVIGHHQQLFGAGFHETFDHLEVSLDASDDESRVPCLHTHAS